MTNTRPQNNFKTEFLHESYKLPITMTFHTITFVLMALISIIIVPSVAYRMDLNFDLQANTLLEVPFIMYNKIDAPATGAPGNGDSKIVLDITASTILQNAAASNGGVLSNEPKIEVVVLEKQDLPKVGGIGDNNERLLCCTEEVRQKYEIECELDQMFTAAKPTGVFQVQSFVLGANDTNIKVHLEFPTDSTTVYYLLMSTCEHDKARLKGYVSALNPYGWLPAQYYRELPFYLTMLVLYCIAGCVWLYLCVRHRAEVVQVHTWFSIVLAVAIFDTLLKFVDVYSWNNTDERNSSLVVFHAISSSALMTCTLTLVLVLSLGLSVVRPSLGKAKYIIGCFAMLFFIFEAGRLVMDRFSVELSQPPPQDDDVDSSGNPTEKSSAQIAYEAAQSFAFILVLPSAILQATTYAWIFNALNQTIKQLEDRKQDVKLKLFTNFQNVLIGSIGIVAIWLVSVTLIRMTGSIEERWNLVWVLESSPDVLYLLVFISIMVLWRPKPNSKKYAYYEQAGTRDRQATLDDDDFDADFSDENEYLPDEFDDMESDKKIGGGGEIEMGNVGKEEDGDEFSLGYHDEYDEDDDDIMA